MDYHSAQGNKPCSISHLTYPVILPAAQLTSSIDYDVEPCDNFYDFACGMWMKRHVVPDDRSNLYTYGVLRDQVSIIVKCKTFCFSILNTSAKLDMVTN